MCSAMRKASVTHAPRLMMYRACWAPMSIFSMPTAVASCTACSDHRRGVSCVCECMLSSACNSSTTAVTDRGPHLGYERLCRVAQLAADHLQHNDRDASARSREHAAQTQQRERARPPQEWPSDCESLQGHGCTHGLRTAALSCDEDKHVHAASTYACTAAAIAAARPCTRRRRRWTAAWRAWWRSSTCRRRSPDTTAHAADHRVVS